MSIAKISILHICSIPAQQRIIPPRSDQYCVCSCPGCLHQWWHRENLGITVPLWGESADHQWIPLTKGQWCRGLMFCLLLEWSSWWTHSWVAGNAQVMSSSQCIKPWVDVIQTRSSFYLQSLTLIPEWISNPMSSKAWDEITYPFPNFNGGTIEVWEQISNFILHFIMVVIAYPCWDYS